MNSRQFAIVIGITFIVGMVWLAADIIFNTKASIEISPKLQTLLESVNPNFNSRVLEIIEKETLDISDVKVTAAPEPPVTQDLANQIPEPREEASASSDLNP